jgi:hypothetical protein
MMTTSLELVAGLLDVRGANGEWRQRAACRTAVRSGEVSADAWFPSAGSRKRKRVQLAVRRPDVDDAIGKRRG